MIYILKAIKKTAFGKSPGKDGIPTYFYEKFAMNNDKMLLKFFKKVIDESHEKEILPRSMREIQIRLLYKKTTEIDKKHMKFYRPISLLNNDYKILSKVLCLRLAPNIHHVLDGTQTSVPTPLSGSFRQLFQQLFRQDRSRQAGLRCSSAVPAPFRQGPGTSPERRWNAARKGPGPDWSRACALI